MKTTSVFNKEAKDKEKNGFGFIMTMATFQKRSKIVPKLILSKFCLQTFKNILYYYDRMTVT